MGLCWPILGLCWSILGLCWPSLGLCWPILELCWPILGYVAPSWSYVGPSWGYVAPSWGLCWPMLTHLEPQAPKKWEKKGRAQNTVQRGGFWRGEVYCGRAAAPLSYGQERNAYGKDTARGPLAGFCMSYFSFYSRKYIVRRMYVY